MKMLLPCLVLIFQITAFAETSGVIQCGPSDTKIPAWIEPGGAHVIEHLNCDHMVSIVGTERGFVKIQIGNRFGYVDAKYVRVMLNEKEAVPALEYYPSKQIQRSNRADSQISKQELDDSKRDVRIINRQDSNTSYTYVIRGYSRTSTNANVNCYEFGNSVNCSGSGSSTTSNRPAITGSYQVQGATFALELPDSRIVIVNCNRKLNWTDFSTTNTYRNCRIPLTNNIEAEFKGDKAKLFWNVSIDGKKLRSETYKILAVIDDFSDLQQQ